MKVCFISHDSGLQGAERALLDMAVNLRDQKGYEILVVLPSCRGGLKDKLDQTGISSSVIPYKWWMSNASQQSVIRSFAKLVFNFVAIFRIVRLLRKQRVDVIYTNSITVNVGAWAAYFLSIPHIWHIHEFAEFAEKDFRFEFDLNAKNSYWLMEKLSNGFVVVSDAILNKYEQVLSRAKLHRIYQSISVQFDADRSVIGMPESGQLNCAVVGKIMPGKRQEDAVLAVALLAKKGINIKLWLIGGDGDTNYFHYLKQLSVEHDVVNKVVFFGFMDNPFNVLTQMNFSIVCSASEAFGRVTVEAMLCGKPVIGSKSGATTELIRDGFNGFFYECGNVEDLAEKIMLLANNSELCLQMGANGKVWAQEQFSVNRYVDEIDGLLRSACRNMSSDGGRRL